MHAPPWLLGVCIFFLFFLFFILGGYIFLFFLGVDSVLEAKHLDDELLWELVYAVDPN